jgi:hypothetical protein
MSAELSCLFARTLLALFLVCGGCVVLAGIIYSFMRKLPDMERTAQMLGRHGGGQ